MRPLLMQILDRRWMAGWRVVSLCVWSAAAGLGLWPAGAHQVVFREIMYHPVAGKPEYIVIANLTATPFDIAEWRMTEGVKFQFPPFSTNDPVASFLRARECLVLSSASEAETRAAYHMPPEVRVLGPWSGKLDNDGERVTLADKNGVTVCTIKYLPRPPWPVAADGTGHSLVLWRINGRLDDHQNWAASARPVQVLDPRRPPEPLAARPGPRLNEVHFRDLRLVDWVELYNPLPHPVSLDGLFLASQRDYADRQPLAGELPPGGCRSWATSWVNRNGEVMLFLVNATNGLLDCRAFEPPTVGASWQAWPDGADEWYAAPHSSRDAPNQPARQTNIVINEIMYDPPDGRTEGEYIELFNRGTATVDLSGWKFTAGIDFRFPAGSRLLPGQFLVVARSVSWMRAAYGDLPVVGNFQRKLSNEGDRIRLEDAAGNLVDEVAYGVGGDWPDRAHGGGSSLELVHPGMDRRLPSAWRASDESAKSEFHTYACTNRYEQLNAAGAPSDYKELHLWLVGDGHVILEELGLYRDGRNCLTNATRLSTDGTGATGWLCQGTHWASYVTNGQLHLISDGRGDNKANRAEIDVPELEPGQTYTLQFRARWLSGKPRLVAQSWDRSLGGSFPLGVPMNLGTPGRTNSCAVPWPLPQVDALAHSPAVPRSTDTIRLTVRVTSAIPLMTVELVHRADSTAGNLPWQTTPLFDDGRQGGDRRANDGLFTGELRQYRQAGQVVQFYVRVEDGRGQRALLPQAGPDRPALLVVDDQPVPRDFRTVRLVVSARDLDAMKHGESARHRWRFPRYSSHYFNTTVIWDEQELAYGVEVRNSGSVVQRSDDLRKPKLKLPDARAFRGRTKFVYDNDVELGRGYHNRVAQYLLYRLGHPANQHEFVTLVVNAGPPVVRDEVEPVGREFLERHFADGNQGELYRMDLEWWFLDDWEGAHAGAEWTYRDSVAPAWYRNAWLKRTRETDDDYSRLIELFQTLSRTNVSRGELDVMLDTDAMLQMVAVRGYLSDWDNFTMQLGRNGYLYRRPVDGRFQFLHWDGDEGYVPGQPFYGPLIQTWVELPWNLPRLGHYLGELNRICAEEPNRLHTWLDLGKAATGDRVVQAVYANFFQKRSLEAAAFIQQHGPPAAQTAGPVGTHPRQSRQGRIPLHPRLPRRASIHPKPSARNDSRKVRLCRCFGGRVHVPNCQTEPLRCSGSWQNDG